VRPNADFKTLGLPSDASWDEVKSAFRRLARLYHPDVAGPDGARKFAEITEAYMTLKESISKGSQKPGAVTINASRGAARSVKATERGEKRESVFKTFWNTLFSRKERASVVSEETFDYDLPPARVRFLGSIISRAESEMQTLLSRRSEVKSRNRAEAILRRLKSRHPGVVMLALQSISQRDATDDMKRAVIEYFTKFAPVAEVLEGLLSLFIMSPKAVDLSRALAYHACGFSPSDSMLILRWFKRHAIPRECYAAFLAHPSDAVIAAALNAWPQGLNLPDSVDLLSLLKKEDESVLVPLLRLMKKERLHAWLVPAITRMMTDNKSPSVRVWASTIVRDQNLS
jgi:hypothetical protein